MLIGWFAFVEWLERTRVLFCIFRRLIRFCVTTSALNEIFLGLAICCGFDYYLNLDLAMCTGRSAFVKMRSATSASSCFGTNNENHCLSARAEGRACDFIGLASTNLLPWSKMPRCEVASLEEGESGWFYEEFLSVSSAKSCEGAGRNTGLLGKKRGCVCFG